MTNTLLDEESRSQLLSNSKSQQKSMKLSETPLSSGDLSRKSTSENHDLSDTIKPLTLVSVDNIETEQTKPAEQKENLNVRAAVIHMIGDMV